MFQSIQRRTTTAMTKDLHCQKIVPSECVTPNVPRIRGSFFNRKFHESGGSVGQLTPSTPRVSANKSVNHRSSGSGTKFRPKRSGSTNDSLCLTNGSSKNGGRPTRSRPNSNEFFEPDFSTPRATRSSLLTPTNGVTTRRNGKITHFYYRPLELDNDSSSESTDSVMKRRHAHNPNRPTRTESPLAIEAPNAEVTLTILEPENLNCIDKSETAKSQSQKEQTTGQVMDAVKKLERKVIEIIEIDHDSDENQNATSEKLEATPPCIKRTRPEFASATQSDIVECSQIKKPAKMVESSQCITPPTTPPDKKNMDSGSPKKISTFIPGNCNIEEVLKLYGQDSSRESDSFEKNKTEAK